MTSPSYTVLPDWTVCRPIALGGENSVGIVVRDKGKPSYLNLIIFDIDTGYKPKSIY